MSNATMVAKSGRRRFGAGRGWRPIAAVLAGAISAGVNAPAMPSAPAGVVETGAPSFVVLGPEALGLSTAPSDMDLLPDGRLLVATQREIAFGDGLRWETFQELDGQEPIAAEVTVDRDGKIYTGVEGRIARIDFADSGRWHFTPVTSLPSGVMFQNSTMTSVDDISDAWYWHGGSGVIVEWRPGRAARIAGNVGAIERIFSLGPEVFVSSSASGGLFKLRPDGGAAIDVPSAGNFTSETVNCSVPFGPGKLLVGTTAAGLKIFDGKAFLPFSASGLLDGNHRINDLCAVGDKIFAAAVDTVGIVFFDSEGHTLQVLERSLDHRLARVRRLQYSRYGVLWALLNEGLARVEFPSPVSHFEPLLVSGLTYAKPLRHKGVLWILADGQAMRGIYDSTGRLDRFEPDSPPGRFLFTLKDVAGQLFAANDQGILVYEAAGWKMILPGIINARVGLSPSTAGGMLYAARGEIGLIQQSGESYTARRFPNAALGDSYGAIQDAAGIVWLELGNSRAARIDPRGLEPKLQILGPIDGLLDGWVEEYVLDGIARFHLPDHLLRYDDATDRFVEDRELLARFPQLISAAGRPTSDNFGHLWYSANGRPQMIDLKAPGGTRLADLGRIGFAPTSYTAQDDGVMWLFEKGRLARLDLRLHQRPVESPHALITMVEFPASDRQLFAPGPTVQTLDFFDNWIEVHFAAPADPFGAPVTFEVLLEGAGTEWVSTGSAGVKEYNRIHEGSYVFRVRPVVGGVTRGAEAHLRFIVLPPWYRTTPAWLVYVFAGVALLALLAWLPSKLQRRKSARLELLVTHRTAELNATNAQLGRQIHETSEKSAALSVSEERYRLLNGELEARVEERTAKLTEASGLLEAMMTNSPDLIYFKDRNSHFVRVSNALLSRFGVREAALLRGKTDSDFFTAEHADAAFADEQEIIRTGGPMIGKLEQETFTDGRVAWALTTKMPWRDGTGAIVGTFGISKDVTELKDAEGKLAYERDQLRALLDTIPDSVYFKDLDCRFVLVSRSKVQQAVACSPDLRAARAARGLPAGVPEAEILQGLTDFDTYRDEGAKLAFEDEQKILRTGESIVGKLEKQVFLDGTTQWWLTSKLPWRDRNGIIVGTFGISKDITALKEAEERLEQMHRQLLVTSRQAGMAEVATGVLHNVGNVLNSVNVSATLVADQVRRSKASNLAKICTLLDQHRADLPAFLTDDPKGQIIPTYLATLAENLAAERTAVVTELENLRKNIEHIKEIVAMQQNYAKTSGINETVSVPDMVEDALRINAGSLTRHDVDIARDYIARPVATLDRHKVIQILINLIRNAKYACDESGRTDKLITVRTTADEKFVRIAIIDNGVGIPAENLTQIFSHGFTTRVNGHGFGLHSGALAARELGGALIAASAGPGHGATFTLELPFRTDASAHEKP